MSALVFGHVLSRRMRIMALSAALAACGGGGGGGGPVGTIELSVANRDTVAHAVVAGAIGLGGADAILGSGAAVGTQRYFAQSVREGRVEPLVVYLPEVRQCNVSGTETTTLDDRDNSGSVTATVGDVLTIVYDQCVDTVGEIWNGTSVATVTQVDANALGFRLVFTALSAVRDGHSSTLDGAALASITAPSSAVARIRLTADGPLVATVSTPVFNDTVTLEPGFVQQADLDVGSLATTSTMSGAVSSAQAGGSVVVTTEIGFVSYSSDAYPQSGVARIAGSTGVLKLTALSTTNVRLDLDANGDGTFEDSSTATWDWLI